MNIADIIASLEAFAPPVYQEPYDNAGLIIGSPDGECKGILVTLDVTEEVVLEAHRKNCNLVVSHHPLIFKGVKRMNGKSPVDKSVVAAIKLDISVYAMHTNLDNVLGGVNGKMADRLGLIRREVLDPRYQTQKKLFTFVPSAHEEKIKDALFAAGAGHIGNYSETSFATQGIGSFKAGEGANPFVGRPGERHLEKETKVEVVFPAHRQESIVRALLASHPYEEVAYDIVELNNPSRELGSGLIGELTEPMTEEKFLSLLKSSFGLQVLRHSSLTGMPLRKIALCGGAGIFLLPKALSAGAQAFVTADVKYHDFFDAEGQILLADIGHYESEQFTIDLLHDLIRQKFPTFAVLKPDTVTNPVNYYF